MASIVLFLVLWSGGIGVVGVAQAEDDAFPGMRIQIDGFSLPERRSGDVWSYQLVDRNADAKWEAEMDGADASPPIGFNLSWVEPRIGIDAEGRMHDVNVLVTSSGQADLLWNHEIDKRTVHIISVGLSMGAASFQESMWLDPLRLDHTSHGAIRFPRANEQPAVACLATSYWDGPLRPGASFGLPPCWSPAGGLDTPSRFGFVAAYAADGHRYVVVDRHDEASTPGIDRLVFRDDIPYPVQITLSYRDTDDASFHAIVRYALVRYEAGDVPLPTVGRDLPALPPLSTGDATWRGIPDDGLDHPFPFSEAVAVAAGDPTDDTLRAFLSRHPEAVVRESTYRTTEGDGSITHEWSFSMHGDRESLPYCIVTRSVPTPTSADNPLADLLPVRQDELVSCSAPQATDEAALGVPARAPTAASLLAAWTVYRSVVDLPVAPAGYIIDRGCGACDDATILYGVGIFHIARSETDMALAGVTPAEANAVRRILWFREDGSLASTVEAAGSSTLSFDATPGPRSVAVTPVSPMTNPPTWAFPDADLLAAASLLAFLVAVVYWVFPFLKQVPLAGLFSRIQRDDALAHPTRSAILEIVTQESGIHERELQRRTGLARGAMQHHLRKLLDHQLIVRRRDGGFTRYGLPEAGVDGPIPLEGTARAIRNIIRDEPELSQTEVGQRLGISRQAVGKHMRRLRTRGELPA